MLRYRIWLGKNKRLEHPACVLRKRQTFAAGCKLEEEETTIKLNNLVLESRFEVRYRFHPLNTIASLRRATPEKGLSLVLLPMSCDVLCNLCSFVSANTTPLLLP